MAWPPRLVLHVPEVQVGVPAVLLGGGHLEGSRAGTRAETPP